VRNATGCAGQSGSSTGLIAPSGANNCFGTSLSGTGLDATGGIAIGCIGSSSGGTGLIAKIANSCAGSGSPPYSVTHPYNMP